MKKLQFIVTDITSSYLYNPRADSNTKLVINLYQTEQWEL